MARLCKPRWATCSPAARPLAAVLRVAALLIGASLELEMVSVNLLVPGSARHIPGSILLCNTWIRVYDMDRFETLYEARHLFGIISRAGVVFAPFGVAAPWQEQTFLEQSAYTTQSFLATGQDLQVHAACPSAARFLLAGAALEALQLFGGFSDSESPSNHLQRATAKN